MATRKSNVINFPQPINPERKDDVTMAEQFFEKIEGLVTEGLRRDLAAAEARVLTADADAIKTSSSESSFSSALVQPASQHSKTSH